MSVSYVYLTGHNWGSEHDPDTNECLWLMSVSYVYLTGHNWGSEHDPDTNECSPSTSSGGKFLMYMYSVSGIERNNKVCAVQYFSVFHLASAVAL